MKPTMVRVLFKFSFLSCNPPCSLVYAISLLFIPVGARLSCSLHCTSPQWPLPVSSFDLCSFIQKMRFSNSSVLLCLPLGFWACQVWIHDCKTHVPFSSLASVQSCSMTKMETTLLMNVRFGNTPSGPLSWREGPPFWHFHRHWPWCPQAGLHRHPIQDNPYNIQSLEVLRLDPIQPCSSTTMELIRASEPFPLCPVALGCLLKGTCFGRIEESVEVFLQFILSLISLLFKIFLKKNVFWG